MGMEVADPLIRGCVVAMVEALLPVLRFHSEWLPTVVDVLFAAVEFRSGDDDENAAGILQTRTQKP